MVMDRLALCRWRQQIERPTPCPRIGLGDQRGTISSGRRYLHHSSRHDDLFCKNCVQRFAARADELPRRMVHGQDRTTAPYHQHGEDAAITREAAGGLGVLRFYPPGKIIVIQSMDGQ